MSKTGDWLEKKMAALSPEDRAEVEAGTKADLENLDELSRAGQVIMEIDGRELKLKGADISYEEFTPAEECPGK